MLVLKIFVSKILVLRLFILEIFILRIFILEVFIIKMPTIKIITGLIFEINCNNRNTEIDLIKILLQLNVLRSEISYSKIVTFEIHLIYC